MTQECCDRDVSALSDSKLHNENRELLNLERELMVDWVPELALRRGVGVTRKRDQEHKSTGGRPVNIVRVI
jgi:hypothetical protein